MKQRLEWVLRQRGLAASRMQAENLIKLRQVRLNGEMISDPSFMVDNPQEIQLSINEQYVSRGALKLDSVAKALKLDFQGKTVLDVGSSTGGFTDYALRHGASKIIAVDSGTDQLHPSLRHNPLVELHEKTDINNFVTNQPIDLVLADVSFVSLREILPHVAGLITPKTRVAALVKPQFEAQKSSLKHVGVIKNDKIRRAILKDFEIWARHYFVIHGKADSSVSGRQGNQERFYLLQKFS